MCNTFFKPAHHNFRMLLLLYLSGNLGPVALASGVPKGSVLGFLAFLIRINDIQSSIKSTIRLFADARVIYRKIIHL
uniref:Putative intron-specific reverse transcriptase n=1 Tax=Ixodes ricinus TaxID=34613 RepID=A0A6B0TW06_IXORI